MPLIVEVQDGRGGHRCHGVTHILRRFGETKGGWVSRSGRLRVARGPIPATPSHVVPFAVRGVEGGRVEVGMT